MSEFDCDSGDLAGYRVYDEKGNLTTEAFVPNLDFNKDLPGFLRFFSVGALQAYVLCLLEFSLTQQLLKKRMSTNPRNLRNILFAARRFNAIETLKCF